MHNLVRQISTECSDFLNDSCGQPVFKLLPKTYTDFHKVKVRHKRCDNIGEVFNQAFGPNNIRQRAVFASAHIPDVTTESEPFFIFPINGFRFLYSVEVRDSGHAYRQVMETLIHHLNDEQEASSLIADLLKNTYKQTNLADGILQGAEIILYNIPFYYALRASTADLMIKEIYK